MTSYDELLKQGSSTGFGQFNGDYGILGTIGSLFTNPLGVWDEFKNGASNRINYQTAMENLAYQRENLDYQKALQEEIFNREDTSYQRTVEDMRNAGLNPLTMNGTNGAGEAIATTPLNNPFQMQDQGLMTAISEIATMLNGFQNFEIGMSKNKQEKANATIAENNAMESTATVEDKIWNSRLENWQKKMMTEDLWRKSIFNNQFGTFDGMDEKSKLFNMLKYYTGSKPTKWNIDYYKRNGKYAIQMFGNDKGTYNITSPTWNTDIESDFERQFSNLMAEQINNLMEKTKEIEENGFFKGFFSK